MWLRACCSARGPNFRLRMRRVQQLSCQVSEHAKTPHDPTGSHASPYQIPHGLANAGRQREELQADVSTGTTASATAPEPHRAGRSYDEKLAAQKPEERVRSHWARIREGGQFSSLFDFSTEHGSRILQVVARLFATITRPHHRRHRRARPCRHRRAPPAAHNTRPRKEELREENRRNGEEVAGAGLSM